MYLVLVGYNNMKITIWNFNQDDYSKKEISSEVCSSIAISKNSKYLVAIFNLKKIAILNIEDFFHSKKDNYQVIIE